MIQMHPQLLALLANRIAECVLDNGVVALFRENKRCYQRGLSELDVPQVLRTTELEHEHNGRIAFVRVEDVC